jgi:hypothetical protein
MYNAWLSGNALCPDDKFRDPWIAHKPNQLCSRLLELVPTMPSQVHGVWMQSLVFWKPYSLSLVMNESLLIWAIFSVLTDSHDDLVIIR